MKAELARHILCFYTLAMIKRYWPMIQSSRTLSMIFQEEPMCAFRRQRNLKDILVSANLSYQPDEEEKVIPKYRNTTCPTLRCKYCNYLDKCEKITSSCLQKNFCGKIGCRTSWLIDNVVYHIMCLKCHKPICG